MKRLRQISQYVVTKLVPPGPQLPHSLPGRLVVSLTSFPPRFATLHLTLASLLKQDVRADETVLWVAHEDHSLLPDSVRALEEAGLTIRTCDDIRSYKKIVPSLEADPRSYIVTADDDVYYARNWLRRFVENYRHQREVLCQRARRIQLHDGTFAPYRTWRALKRKDSGWYVFPTGVGGVFYPPGSLPADTSRADEFGRLCPSNDDIWLYWMAKKAGYTHRMLDPSGSFTPWPTSQRTGLWQENVRRNQNDQQIMNMLEQYGMPDEITRARRETKSGTPARPSLLKLLGRSRSSAAWRGPGAAWHKRST